MSNLFASADIDECRAKGHRFKVVGSEKTPLKRSLMCDTCTVRDGISTYVAYGDPLKSWGQWRDASREKSE